MWVNDSTSSQAVQRQRRHAADEKQRVERVATDTAVREEGAIRQAGEAPTHEEVQRFRALMQTRGAPQQTTTRAPTREGADVPVAAASAETPSPSTQPTMADRFRALFQRTADAQPQPQPSTSGERSAEEPPPPVSTPQTGAKPDSMPGGRNSAANSASSAGKPRADAATSESDAAKAVPAEVSKLADGDGRRAQDARTPVATRKHDDGAAETTQRAAQQVARGEVQTPPVVRKAHGDDTAGGDGDALSRPMNSPALPSMTPSDMAAPVQRMPDAPQQMAATAGLVAPALAELIQKHVKQMLVSETRGSGARSRELLLRMQSDVLPGTDLWLTRTENGWRMRADVRSRDAYDTLLANQNDLIQRFADSALGELSIEPVFHG